ncbi:flagellar hook-associated protein FlgK [Kineothrix sp. MB12-C1]|uniref:flagellar hook-associated protein FlgK n=1 Tax=Kineothrix sp. MB12-C1 TaxID=3070215 RepID=UPI0027D30BCF|nr:flagellar hook-associated protein FlgK [Kineothrix sp. MB12-C1]WMC93893.1 flagellar hook-associated protein FlgK [Kineothrix sp. MB12-C1]
MPSQFFGLTIASSGLRAANAALNTAGNNISNVHTDGYSRQTVSQEATDALRVFATYGCAGAGVDTVAIERIRDSYYDMRFRNNNTTLGEYDVKKYYTGTIQQYLDDDGISGFGTIYDAFWATLQGVSTAASATDSKAQFIAAAQSMAEYFNNTAGNLKELQKDINSEIKIRVDRINAIATEIATLNKQINVIEMTGAAANELRDKRDLMLDELSEIVDIETQEVAVTDANNPNRETGGTRFIVSIAGGQPLVNGNDFNTLECRSRAKNEKINMTDADGLYDIYWNNGNEFNLNNAAMGGALKGLVAMRDGNNSQAFSGIVTNVGRTADGADAEVRIKVTQEHLKNMDKNNLSDTGGSIVIGNTIYYYKSWEYDEANSTYIFRMDDAKCDSVIDASKIAKEAEVGKNISYQGIPYYLSQMNEFVRAFAAKVNEIFASGFGATGEEGEILFTAAKAMTGSSANDSQYDKDDFLSSDKGYYEMTAFNLQINNKLLANADLLGTRSSKEVGVEECGKITELIATLSDKTKFNFRNATASEFLQNLLSDVALNASNANTFYDTYFGIAVTIENQRASISGVDEDEEATNMIKFQNAYTLSSKMVQVLTEIYDRLILETGV